MTLELRPATDGDAAAGMDVIRRSIKELCRADHHDDPAELAAWLANKTIDNWSGWLGRRDAALIVAEDAAALCGVGMVSFAGEIVVNYVAPEARFRGVSKAMMRELERLAFAQGARVATLESTVAAQPFYLAQGYTAIAGGDPMRMGKRLVPMS